VDRASAETYAYDDYQRLVEHSRLIDGHPPVRLVAVGCGWSPPSEPARLEVFEVAWG
jgi:hypothetical protein